MLLVAHSGVAAANLGGGASTIDSIFRFGGDNKDQDLEGTALDELIKEIGDAELLVIDEISTVGAGQLEMISRRLEQVAKAKWQFRFNTKPPASFGGFGGLGVLCMGDFAQLPPVLATSLLPGSRLLEPRASNLRALAMDGRIRFQKFSQVVRLRHIHRQKDADPYKESTIRLRDVAITEEDYALWQEHELPDVITAPSWSGGEDLHQKGLVLTAENEAAGRLNGARLRLRAPAQTNTQPLAVTSVVVRCEAQHNEPRAAKKPSDQFRQLRPALHLCLGAPVMLTQNRLWGSNVVPFGLMNGARGTVVAMLFKELGSQRTDEQMQAGTGFPCGRRNCPLPDFVVVHFPTYTGPALFDGSPASGGLTLPSTWVPIPCTTARCEYAKRYERCQLPLRLAWAITIHKSQGLSLPEGVIVDLKTGSPTRNPVATLGLAFVAWTRVTSWTRMAFCNLPTFDRFLVARASEDFKLRETFEANADDLHATMLLKRGISPEREVELHLAWYRLQPEHSTNGETDVTAMLSQKGVAPLPRSVVESAKARLGRNNCSLKEIVTSFRGRDTGLKNKISRGKPKHSCASSRPAPSATESKGIPHASNFARDVCCKILVSHGYCENIIEEALQLHGGNVRRAVEYCLQPHSTSQCDTDPVSDGPTDLSTLLQLGFHPDLITEAINQSNGDIQKACRLLFVGLDEARDAYDMSSSLSKAKRRTDTRNFRQMNRHHDYSVLFQEYQSRAHDELHVQAPLICDLGMQAGPSTNACLWLCLAVGWSKCNIDVPSDIDSLRSLSNLRNAVRELPVEAWCNEANAAPELVQQLAFKLRTIFCAGDNALMRSQQVMMATFPAFAALAPNGRPMEVKDYHHWLGRVATQEFADELVVATVASQLRVEIIIVPHTPLDAIRKWSITTYKPPTIDNAQGRRIILGNNDVHFVLIVPH